MATLTTSFPTGDITQQVLQNYLDATSPAFSGFDYGGALQFLHDNYKKEQKGSSKSAAASTNTAATWFKAKISSLVHASILTTLDYADAHVQQGQMRFVLAPVDGVVGRVSFPWDRRDEGVLHHLSEILDTAVRMNHWPARGFAFHECIQCFLHSQVYLLLEDQTPRVPCIRVQFDTEDLATLEIIRRRLATARALVAGVCGQCLFECRACGTPGGPRLRDSDLTILNEARCNECVSDDLVRLRPPKFGWSEWRKIARKTGKEAKL